MRPVGPLFALMLGRIKSYWRLLPWLINGRRGLAAAAENDNFRFIADHYPGHFYSPIPDLAEVKRNAPLAGGVLGVELRPQAQRQFLAECAEAFRPLPFSVARSDGFRYYLDNPFFSFGDGIILYCMLRRFKPKHIIEIGSGFSSAAMLDTADRYLGRDCRITFIEPYPDRLRSLLRAEDLSRHSLEVKPVQQVDLSIFDQLAAGDILFVDSSHVAKSGSDLAHILFNILPRVQRGVIVHFHDIFWPFEYPLVWYEAGRAWNEAFFLRAFLQYNSAFEVLFFNSYMAETEPKTIEKLWPEMLSQPSFRETMGNSSLWLQRL